MSKHGYRLDHPAQMVFPFARCGKVFISGVCSHQFNSICRMHTCSRFLHHKDECTHPGFAVHRCTCGKEWTDAGMSETQYAEAAFIKAVE